MRSNDDVNTLRNREKNNKIKSSMPSDLSVGSMITIISLVLEITVINTQSDLDLALPVSQSVPLLLCFLD